eukprot:TRINITY_DN4866_c0_g1_i2.p1 TRINITY_DN4866_c0_g1~~TRINITY_DN4866_c0_g1_i2.p1  ORF type:complete len:236 (+),score=41.36 TRINITY_DN4866_c0_g1_i2:663-1370(+)
MNQSDADTSSSEPVDVAPASGPSPQSSSPAPAHELDESHTVIENVAMKVEEDEEPNQQEEIEEDQSFANLLNDQSAQPNESSVVDTKPTGPEPDQNSHSIPERTSGTALETPSKPIQPTIYGTLRFSDPTLRWRSGEAVYNITKKSIIIGRTRSSESKLDVNMEGITENAKYVSHEHLKIEITPSSFAIEVLGRNPVSVNGKDLRRDSGVLQCRAPKKRCSIILGKTELLLHVLV